MKREFFLGVKKVFGLNKKHLSLQNIYISIGTNGTIVQMVDFFFKDAELQLSSLFECVCDSLLLQKEKKSINFSIAILNNNREKIEVKKMSNAILGIVYAQCDELYLNAIAQLYAIWTLKCKQWLSNAHSKNSIERRLFHTFASSPTRLDTIYWVSFFVLLGDNTPRRLCFPAIIQYFMQNWKNRWIDQQE